MRSLKFIFIVFGVFFLFSCRITTTSLKQVTPPPAPTPTPTGSSTAPSMVWVQTWESAMAYTNTALSNQTLRIIARTSLGGSTFRVRLSNQFATAPLTVNESHIAVSTGNGSINPNTDRTLTFSGSTAVTIPAGAEIYSDSTSLTVESQTLLAVSLYFAQSTGAIATHYEANATSYMGNGNGTGAVALGGLSSFTSVAVVDGIDVQAASNARGIVAFGDSITDGVGSTLDAYTRWTDVLVNLFTNSRKSNDGLPPVAVSNAGIGGNQVVTDFTNGVGTGSFGPNGIGRFPVDALSRSGVTDVILLEGINDLGYGGSSASAIINGYTQMINAAHSHQPRVNIYLATLTPIRNSTGPSPSEGLDGSDCCFGAIDPNRQILNQWIRTSSLIDGYVEFERAVGDPSSSTITVPASSGTPYSYYSAPYTLYQAAYSSSDELHPDNAGYKLMGSAIPLNWFNK